MTCHRTLAGLTFQAHFPSLFQLVATRHPNDLIEMLCISFDGDRWRLNVLMMAAGHSIERWPFRTRDAAAEFLAGRLQERAS